MRRLASIAALLLCASPAAAAEACSKAPESAVSSAEEPSGATEPSAEEGRPVSNLPYARGRTFRTLDEYLAHLEQQGAIDLPWWREVAPGVYERVTSMRPRGEPERATRAELMERYGFTR